MINITPLAWAWTDWLIETKFLNNELWRWLALLGVLLVGLLVGKVVSLLLQKHGQVLCDRQKSWLLGRLLRSLSGPVTMLALAVGLYIAAGFMNLRYESSPPAEGGVPVVTDLKSLWLNACSTIAVLATGWFIYKLVDAIEFFLLRWTSKTNTLLDDQLVPIIRKTLRIFVVVVAGLFIAQNIFHWQIGAMLAGLGIGGLAFALAAKDTLANFFGSVTIFTDRPFQMGERIVVKGYDGTVEEVGFRSTRIRLLNGHLVTVPNSVIANETVENISRRPYIKRTLEITVTYDTAPEKLQRGVEIIRQMLDARKDHFAEGFPPRVYFGDFGAASLNIVVYYWFTPPDWWEYLAFNHDFNTELLRRFNEEAIKFAFPTQTLYLKQD
ncbi:MAG: mechanosensitive ion channel [Planctomycetota bacterium]|nr:mechanosensitive ion channel [Planctomycetota bacterium]